VEVRLEKGMGRGVDRRNWVQLGRLLVLSEQRCCCFLVRECRVSRRVSVSGLEEHRVNTGMTANVLLEVHGVSDMV